MSKTKGVSGDEQVLADFRAGMGDWGRALEAHRLAPRDAGFADRLAGFAAAAAEAARVCRMVDAAGFDWTPHRAATSKPPYELQPDTGRRGPVELWGRFDRAVAALSVVAAGREILDVAAAYEELGAVAEELAQAVEREDRAAAGERPRARSRARRAG